jgi:hypothetical protein
MPVYKDVDPKWRTYEYVGVTASGRADPSSWLRTEKTGW